MYDSEHVMIFAPVSHDPVPDHCTSVALRKDPCPEYLRRDLWCSYCHSRWTSVEEYAFGDREVKPAEIYPTECRLNGLKCPDRFPHARESWCQYCKDTIPDPVDTMDDLLNPEPWEIDHLNALIADAAAGPFPDLEEAPKTDPETSHGGFSAKAQEYAAKRGFYQNASYSMWHYTCEVYDTAVEDLGRAMGYPVQCFEGMDPTIPELRALLQDVTESYGLRGVRDPGQVISAIAQMIRQRLTKLESDGGTFWVSTQALGGDKE